MLEHYSPSNSYKSSKLFQILFTNELNRQYAKGNKNFNSYSVSPGIVLTNLSRYFPATYGLLYRIGLVLSYPFRWYLFKSPRQGAQTILYCAVEPNLTHKVGYYFRNLEQQKQNGICQDDSNSRRLWLMSEKLVKKWL
jgi:retinol dehydrogenase 12